MMKLKTIATTCLAVSGLAMAQDHAAGTAAPRTGLYTLVTKSNAAADNTVDDYSRRPTLIGDKQYLAGFGDANLQNAAFSIEGMGWNWFGSVLQLTSLAQIRAGLAKGTAWGAGLEVGVNRTHNKTGATGAEGTTYFEPSGIALFGDFNVGSGDVYGQVGWNTGFPSTVALENSVWTKPAAGAEDDDQQHTLSIMGGWKKDATTEGTHAFNIEGSYATEMTRLEGPTVDATDNFFVLAPMWGYILRANASYSVFIGANSKLVFIQRDQGIQDTISISPNFAFQKQFGHGIEGFSGFSVRAAYGSQTDRPADNDELSQLITGQADMAVGLRWVKDNFALEGSLQETVLANGPYFVGGNADQGLFAHVGLSLGI